MPLLFLSENLWPSEEELTELLVVLSSLVERFVGGQGVGEMGKQQEIF